LWTAEVNRLTDERAALEKGQYEAAQNEQHLRAQTQQLRLIQEWCAGVGEEMAQASYEEKHFLLRGLRVKVTCYRSDHTPRYSLQWDVGGLRPALQQLVQPLTDRDIAEFTETGLESPRSSAGG
jgi:hypothetical protein